MKKKSPQIDHCGDPKVPLPRPLTPLLWTSAALEFCVTRVRAPLQLIDKYNVTPVNLTSFRKGFLCLYHYLFPSLQNYMNKGSGLFKCYHTEYICGVCDLA